MQQYWHTVKPGVGKTHTIMGPSTSLSTAMMLQEEEERNHAGVIPRAIRSIFHQLQAQRQHALSSSSSSSSDNGSDDDLEMVHPHHLHLNTKLEYNFWRYMVKKFVIY